MGDFFNGFSDVISNIPILGDLLGGNNATQRTADAAAKASADAAAAETARNQNFQSSQAAQQAKITADQQAATDKASADLEKARTDAAKQAAALASTGGSSLTPGAPLSAGLPGFDSLKKRTIAGATPGLQQSNLINPAPTLSQAAGVNSASGGRRYV